MRKLSILFIFLLIFQTITSSTYLPTINATEESESVFKVLSLTDKEGNSIEMDEVEEEDEAVLHVNWSAENINMDEEYAETLSLPQEIVILEEQEESLTDGDQVIGTFLAETDGSITIQFESGDEELDARGTITIDALVRVESLDDDVLDEETDVEAEENKKAEESDEEHSDEELNENEQSAEKDEVTEEEQSENEQVQEDADEDYEEEADSDVVGEDEEEENENESSQTEVEQNDENEEADLNLIEKDEEEIEGETLNIRERILSRFNLNEASEGTEITENIITNVTVTVTTNEGEEISEPGTPIRVEDPYDEFKVDIRYDFELPNNHGYRAGATYTIELPDMLTIQNNPEPTNLTSEDGTVFATFIVQDNEIIITFNENIEGNSNISGHIEAESEFDAHYEGLAESNLTFPIQGESDITYPIIFVPKGSSIDKTGIGNKGYNTETIEWTIDFNKDFQEIENAILEDKLTEGDHEFIPGTIKVYKLNLNADGTFHSAEELEGYENAEFPLRLGDIDSPYRVTYETEINDDVGTTYKNEATLKDGNIDLVQAGATVEVTRGVPLDKSAIGYDNVDQIITWEVMYNYDEKEINQELAKLTDEFGENQTLLLDSFEIYEVEIDQDTGAELGTTPVDANDYTVDETENGFELQFNYAIDKAYKISYQTKASDRVFENFDVNNTIHDEFENESVGGQLVEQGIFIKSHDGNPNYNDKETSWTVIINRDRQQMREVVFTDVLPVGMTPKNVEVKHGGAPLTEGTDYTYDYNSDNREIRIEFENDITETVRIMYETKIDYDAVDWVEDLTFNNNALLEWIPENETESTSKRASAVFTPDEYTQHNGFKGGSYNPVTKEITWTIGVNYNKANLESVVVKDFIQGDQNFDIDNVKVYHMELTGGEYGYDYGDEVESPNIEQETGPNGEAGFSVNLGDINTPYIIEFTTDLNDQLIVGSYDNVASVSTNNRGNTDLEAKVEPVHGGEYTKKNASQNDQNPRIVNWNIDINFTQSTLNNVKIKDTPSINQAINRDSFVLYGTEVTDEGLVKDENTILVEGTDYTLIFKEDDGQESFTLAFSEETIERGYVLEYDTYILYTGGEIDPDTEEPVHNRITNEAVFNANEDIPGETDFIFNETINLSRIGGGITGEVGSLEVIKVDADDDSLTLEGAVFELYDETGEVLLRTAVTDENGKAVFNNLLHGNYILKETEAPEYYVVGIVDELPVTFNGESVVITNEKIKQHFELTKVDDKDRTPLQGVEFELYEGTHPNGELVQGLNLVTDEDGKILIEHLPGGNADEGLPAGDYYLVETKAANEHYEISTVPIRFTINQDQTTVTTITAENNLTPGSASFTKVDGETNAHLSEAEFGIYYMSYGEEDYDEEFIRTVTTDSDGYAETGDLRPGTYQLREVTPPYGYELLAEPIEFEIVVSQEEQLNIGNIANEVKTTILDLTKIDSITGVTLEGAKFVLTYKSNEYDVSSPIEGTTNNQGKIIFEGLKPGIYELTESNAPEGYITTGDSIEIVVTLDDVQSDENMSRTIENDPLVHIIVEKVDSETRANLDEAIFGITDQEGNLIEGYTNLITNEDGRIDITGLPAGDYRLVETKAPTGYSMNSKAWEFSIIDEEETHEIFFTEDNAIQNDIIKGSVTLTKQDAETKEKLEGVVFKLQNISLVNGGTYQTTTHTTDENGEIVVDDLRPGLYKFVEIEQKDGYQLHDWEPIEFTIDLANEDGESHAVELTVENYKLVNIPVTKVWNDNDDEGNARPESITINLVQNDTLLEEKEIVLNNENDWQGTFEGLDAVDSNGNPYRYEVEEASIENIENYIVESIEGDSDNPEAGFTITNVLTTGVTINKDWEDDENATNDRPTSVEVTLYRDGVEIERQTIYANQDWTHTFTDLPVYDTDGNAYEYTIEEQTVEGYEQKSVDRTEEDLEVIFDITNVRTDETEFVVRKEWKDEEGTAARPNDDEGITIYLFQKLHNEDEYPDEPYKEETITPGNYNWEYVFENIPLFNENGVAYEYEVREEPILGYESIVEETSEGFNITNVRSEQIDINVMKVWNDDNNIDSREPITVHLIQNGNQIAQEILDSNNEWNHTFTGIERFDNEGQPFEYSVEEITDVDGYVVNYTGDAEDGFVITNTRSELVNVSGTKTWLDGDSEDRPDSITVNLYQDGDLHDTAEITAEDDWEYTFEDLPGYDGDGIAYEYTVSEEDIEGYESVVNGYDITNTRSEKTSISVEKIWLDGHSEDRPESITVQLLRNGEMFKDTELNEDNDWQYEFGDIDVYDENGIAYTYEVVEAEVTGYETNIAGSMEEGFTITNLRVGSVDIEGEKVWKDDNTVEGRPDSVTINLLQNGAVINSQTISENDNWRFSFEGLDEFDENGVAYTYTVEEAEVPEGYESTTEGYDIINVRTGTTSVEGNKTWVDENEGDRPESITVNLLQNGVVIDTQEVTAEDNWSYIFEDLDQFDENGVEYEYTISEQDVPGYESTVDGYDLTNTRSELKDITITKAWLDDDSENRPNSITVTLYQNGNLFETVEITAEDGWAYTFEDLDAFDDQGVAYEYSIEEEPVEGYETTINGFDITNLRVGTIVVEGTKTWLDEDSPNRPESITVDLLQNGEVIDTVEVTEDANWTYVFTDLPEFDEEGKAYEYTVQEHPIEGYVSIVSGFDMTNVRYAEITIEGTKTWVGDDDSVRPDSITVDLLQNGETVETMEVTAEMNWTYEFTNLPEFDEEGVPFVYTIEERPVEGYETVVNGFDITNTLIPVEETDEEEVSGVQDKEDDTLTQTSLNIMFYISIGLSLVLAGIALLFIRKRRAI